MAVSTQTQILPPELEHYIFEIAAFQSLQTAAKLTLVARRVRLWIEPIIYSVFILTNARKSYPPFYVKAGGTNITLDTSRLKRLGKHVRHLVIQQRSHKTIQKILDYCPNIENLALWLVDGSTAPLVPVLKKLPVLRNLSLDTMDFIFLHGNPDHSSRPLALDVTHLDLVNFCMYVWTKLEQIASLPKLTHLALTGWPDASFVQDLLRECPKLELLVVIYVQVDDDELVPRVMETKIEDKRLVETRSTKEHGEYWNRGSLWGKDFWKIFEDMRDSK